MPESAIKQGHSELCALNITYAFSNVKSGGARLMKSQGSLISK